MRILFVCHRFPFPPSRGGKIRPFNMIRHLAMKHEVHVASLAHDDADVQGAPGIKEYCASYQFVRPPSSLKWARMLALLPSSMPSSMGYFYSPVLQRKIDALVQSTRFDLFIVHCAFVADYVAHFKGVPKLLDFGDMDSQKWLAYSRHRSFPLSAAFWLEGLKMRRAEARLARLFDFCTATTELEHEDLKILGAARRTDWFPNGVDLEYFSPLERISEYDSDKIVFVGRLDYFPNQQAIEWFASAVLPRVRAARPSARLVIVGANPPKQVWALAAHEAITVTGTVPDVREHLRTAALSVAPLLIARGVQNKILESLAMGIPVVASSTAAKGVDAVPTRDFLVADDPDTFANSVLRIMESTDERSRLSVSGRARVAEAHSWVRSMERLDKVIEALMSIRERTVSEVQAL